MAVGAEGASEHEVVRRREPLHQAFPREVVAKVHVTGRGGGEVAWNPGGARDSTATARRVPSGLIATAWIGPRTSGDGGTDTSGVGAHRAGRAGRPGVPAMTTFTVGADRQVVDLLARRPGLGRVVAASGRTGSV